MTFKILGETTDLRTNTVVIYAQMNINEYLSLVGEDFDKFAIQRPRQKHKAYKRMKSDISSGALLPPITLAVDPEIVPSILNLRDRDDQYEYIQALFRPGQVSILDGLQRTYTLKDLLVEGAQFREDHTLLVEFWLERNFKHLIYRIIVLNAGQKPMTMRHQIEILFSTFKKKLESDIPNLELLQEKDEARRTRSRKFTLDKIVSSYQSYLTKSPEIQKENIVAQQLVEEDILSDSEENFGLKFDMYERYLDFYAQLDDEICRVYDGSLGTGIMKGTLWFGNENVINAFFAAVADFGATDERLRRVDTAIFLLLDLLRSVPPGSDPLSLGKLQDIIQGFNTRKVNVGFATRKLLFSSFKEFFRDEGETPLGSLWAIEAE
jgi:hypothetical protein